MKLCRLCENLEPFIPKYSSVCTRNRRMLPQPENAIVTRIRVHLPCDGDHKQQLLLRGVFFFSILTFPICNPAHMHTHTADTHSLRTTIRPDISFWPLFILFLKKKWRKKSFIAQNRHSFANTKIKRIGKKPTTAKEEVRTSVCIYKY